MARQVILVLAGVNGAGKSSVGGHILTQAGLSWFNPDDYAQALQAETRENIAQANAAAWHEGLRRLDMAMALNQSHALETTLGGSTIAKRLLAASRSHDVRVWYCGLKSPEQHIARVKARVAAGGHDVAEALIRQRLRSSRENLIALMPHVAQVQIWDNSAQVAPGDVIPEPRLLAEVLAGQLYWPTDLTSLQATPDWAKPLLEAALDGQS